MTTVDEVRRRVGEGPFVSDWLTVTQELMDGFGVATRDMDWMHTDPDRARREGFDGTIAFGFWTVSMLTHFLRESTGQQYPAGARYGFNYGLDRVRFLAPIPVGARIRNHLTLREIREKGPGRFVVTTHNRVEMEGRDDPVMLADWLVMFVFPERDDSEKDPR